MNLDLKYEPNMNRFINMNQVVTLPWTLFDIKNNVTNLLTGYLDFILSFFSFFDWENLHQQN